MIDNRPDKKQAAYILADEINDIMLQLAKAVNVLDDVATKYFGQGTPPAGWALTNEYHRYSTKVEIVADYLWDVGDRLKQLEAFKPEEGNANESL